MREKNRNENPQISGINSLEKSPIFPGFFGRNLLRHLSGQ